MIRPRSSAIAFLLIFFTTSAFAAIKPEIPDAATLHLMMKRLNVVGGALYLAAHPDDENTAILSYLAMGKLVRTAYLAINRGEGGQNLIGPEQGELLGLIRTQELLSARGIDHANQFFTRAIDFGYSKTPYESLQFWGKDKVLSDVVWVIRKFRPDVIILRFPPSGGGHGHHTASAILGQQAFHAAADPEQFPEQLKYVNTWQPKRIVWNRYSFGQPIPDADKASSSVMQVGEYNPLLGKSYTEVAGVSRSMHKSQGFGDSEDRGQAANYFQLIAGDPAQSDLLEGVDLTWGRIKGASEIQTLLAKTYSSFRADDPAASIPALMKAHSLMKHLQTNPAVAEKMEEVKQVILACAGLWLEGIAEKPMVSPGDQIKVAATAINRSQQKLTVTSSGVFINSNGSEKTKTDSNQSTPLPYNVPVSHSHILNIPVDTSYSQPYWLNGRDGRALAHVKDQTLIGLPESPPALSARFTIEFGTDELEFFVPVFYRWVDPVHGERYRRVEIVPAVAVNLSEPVSVFNDGVRKIRVLVQGNQDGASGKLRLQLPAGWKADPVEVPLVFAGSGDSMTAEFSVNPGPDAQSGTYTAEAEIGGKIISSGMKVVDYPHILPQTTFPSAEGKLVRVNTGKITQNVGYIMGSGDQVPQILRQLGFRVTELSDEDLISRDLSGFDAMISGIRAYNTRSILRTAESRLLDYVEQGGTYVVQYNTLQDLVTPQFGPYPFTISRDRISVEESPVNLVNASHSLLNQPNKITQSDFDGWVQERGLYFPSKWDSKYETVISSADPGESMKEGGVLYARYGKGVYIYTTFSYFRQLPAGVPGAIRLFVNLILAQ